MDLFLAEEERLLQRTVRDFTDREVLPRAAEIDESQEFPWAAIRKLGEMGLMGLAVDPKYGGSGGGYMQLAIAVEELARGCGATSLTFLASLSLGCQTIYRFGNEEQRQKWVVPHAQGKALYAFALTEPNASSDPSALQTTATRTGDYYVLNGRKLFITNGDVADAVVIFVTHDRSLRHRGIDAVVVEKGTQGFSAHPMHGKMGMRASTTCELVFDDCRVQVRNRLGGEGEGFKIAMEILDGSRIAVAAQAVGIAQGALEAATQYSKQRETFGRPIAEHQAVAFMLADMATETQAARLLTYHAARLKDAGQPYKLDSAMAKLFASETAMRVAHRAVQIHGGAGYFKPSPVERYFREAKALEIYEGTSEIQRIVISRGVLDRGS